MSANSNIHKDHIPDRKKEKIGTTIFLISGSLFLCLAFIYIFAYAVPESKAEKQNAEKIATQQREYLDDKFANSIFNKMYRGVLNEKNNIIQVLYPYQQTVVSSENNSENDNNGFTIAMSESYLIENDKNKDDSLCTYVRIKADNDLVHLTNDNFAYIIDNSDNNENVFDENNKGQFNNNREQFSVSLKGTHVDVDRFDKNGDSDKSVTVRPHQEVEFSLCLHLPANMETEDLKSREYHWAVLDSNKESLAQWTSPISDVLKVDKARKFKF